MLKEKLFVVPLFFLALVITALLKPGPDGLQVIGRFTLVTEKVRDAWTHPVLHDGRLYLRYHDTLFCYDVKQR